MLQQTITHSVTQSINQSIKPCVQPVRAHASFSTTVNVHSSFDYQIDGLRKSRNVAYILLP